MKYRYGLLFILAAVSGVYLSIFYVNPYNGTIDLSEMILQFSGSRGSFELGFSYEELASFAMHLIPTFLFELYAGIMLYRHFCTASIYVFSRYPHRVKWYLKEVSYLGGTTGAFHIILLLAATVTTVCRFELRIDYAGMLLTTYHFLLYTLWVYIMTLSVNLIAIFFGSSAAYALVVGVQMVCIALLNFMDLLVRNSADRLSYEKILIWNPIAHLVLGWRSSYMRTDLNASLLLFFLLWAAVTFAGAMIVKKHDILVSDSETGGI